MGYSINKKGYKVYNIENGIEIISKDVIFYERLVPYHFMELRIEMNKLKIFFLLECSEASGIVDQSINTYDFNHLHDFTSVMKDNSNINNQ